MIEQGYKVIAEFRFDVGSAILNSQTLQNEVGKISTAADNAQAALGRVGVALMGEVGLGYLSVGAVIMKSVTASEKFYQTQLKLSNVLMGSGLMKGNSAFEDSMTASADAMERMKKAARAFGLPAQAMVDTSLGVGAALTNKGLDDSSLKKSVDLSRQFLKSAPILLQGQDPSAYIPQLIGAISGRAEIGGTLVQRLIDETGAMGKFKGTGGAGKFNALKDAERLDILTKALAQFSGQGKVVAAMANSLTGQMQRLRDNLFGVFGVFNKIGTSLRKFILPILNKVNFWLEDNGDRIASAVGKFLDRVLKDPIKMYAQLQQLSGMKKDFAGAGAIIKYMMFIHGIASMAGFIRAIPLGPATGAVSKLVGFFEWINTGLLKKLFPALGGAKWMPLLGQIFGWFTIFFAMMQAATRGAALAKVDNAQWMADNAGRFTEAMDRMHQALSAIFSPFERMIEGFAELFRWVFSSVILLEGVTSGMEIFGFMLMWLGKAIVAIYGVVGAVMNGLTEIMTMFTRTNPFTFEGFMPRMKEALTDGFKWQWEKYFPEEATDPKKVPVSGQNIAVDKVVINNTFKEQMEPDRIAFALKDQLMKAASNPLQASRNSLTGKAVR